MENWNFIAAIKFTNVEIICEIENEETLQTTNFHISHEHIADHLDVDCLYRDEFDNNGYSDACEHLFNEYKTAAAENKEDDLIGMYVQSPKRKSIVFQMRSAWTGELEYVIPYKNQTNAKINEIALEIGAASHSIAMR